MNEIQEKSPLRIFLCHSSGDKTRVRALYQRLSSEGFDPWLDEEKLLPGQEWKLEIPKAVRASHIVLICLSSNAINKAGYVQKEIKYALDVAEEQPEGTIFLIPLKLEECDVPERLGRWHWVNYYEENGYERLMSSLRMRAETEESETFTTLKDMKFVLIQPGEFDMGSPTNEVGRDNDEGPVHHVTIPEPFYMSKYEVTQKQWSEVMVSNPSYFKGNDLPVENVSWEKVQQFIRSLNAKEGTDKYRLPTEAEWEFAARAVTTTRYSFGEDESELEDHAWYWENSEGRRIQSARKSPIPGVSMICMAMCGNGYWINGMMATKALLQMAVHGRMEVAPPGFFVAAAVSSMLITVGRPFAATSPLVTASTTWAFAFFRNCSRF